MKRRTVQAICVSVVGIFLASQVHAQAGTIGLFRDPGGLDCTLADYGPGLTPVYVVHVSTPGAIGCRFSAPLPACWTGATWFADTQAFPQTSGNTQTGVSVFYEVCRTPPILVLTIQLFTHGQSQRCCPYFVLGDPRSDPDQIEVVSCSFDTLKTTGGVALVNADATCSDCGYYLFPPELRNPAPADSATGLPLDADLSWQTYDPQEWPLDYELFFGLSSNPPHVAWLQTTSYDPGLLRPDTTYYWNVIALKEARMFPGPKWTFKTTRGVGVEQNTWGAIKALYQ